MLFNGNLCQPPILFHEPEALQKHASTHNLEFYKMATRVQFENNNEIGVIQDIEAIGKITRERGIIFHVDAAQSPGKVAIDVNAMNVDLMSLCAHKVYGPKGIGALYVRRKPRVRLEAQIHGGGHERGMRSGTLATHQIVGMGESFRIAHEEMDAENARMGALRDRLWAGFADMIRLSPSTKLKLTFRLPGMRCSRSPLR